MKTIRYNLTKTYRISQLSNNRYISIWGFFLKKIKKFHLFIEELYARLYHLYARNIEFVSILK